MNKNLNIAYFNGNFLPKEEISISPDDRGFLFADGIYEVVRWYQRFFYDMEGHLIRLKRSLNELNIVWPDVEKFPSIARELIMVNNLENNPALIYFQVTRGAAPRTHNFPDPVVPPTTYAFARSFLPDDSIKDKGVSVILKKEMRWSRCDIKSISLLPNTLSFQEATEKGCSECLFIRDGLFTEGSHSNVFFVIKGTLYTHPESDHILSGITRKNVIRIAKQIGLSLIESAIPETMIENIDEAFLANTGGEVIPIIKMGKWDVGNGKKGRITKLIMDKFKEEIISKEV